MSKDKNEHDKKKLNAIREKQENLERTMDRVWQEEEEEDEKNLYWNRKLDEMISNTEMQDSKLNALMEERQSFFQSMRKKQREFLEQFEEEIKKEKKQLEKEAEDIQKESKH